MILSFLDICETAMSGRAAGGCHGISLIECCCGTGVGRDGCAVPTTSYIPRSIKRTITIQPFGDFPY